MFLGRTVEYMHRQQRHQQWFPNPSLSLSLSTNCVAGICSPMVASGEGGPMKQTAINLPCVLPFICSTRTTTTLDPIWPLRLGLLLLITPWYLPSAYLSLCSSLACFGSSLRRSPVLFSPTNKIVRKMPRL
jgi:hypothetical protein